MTQHDLSGLVTAFAIILTFGISGALTLYHVYAKKQKKTVLPREPRRPVGYAYMEMFDKIYHANTVSDMNCIKPLLKDYMAEYERHESPETLKADYKTIKRMRLDKISELRGTVSRLSTV
jgi:hypothetical protein